MSSVLAIIPARSGSKGIPNKNFRKLCGLSPLERAIAAARQCIDGTIAVTSDMPTSGLRDPGGKQNVVIHIQRRACLAQDDTPMIAVVQHVLGQIPGPPDQKIVLLQPTQPLRTPAHITKALELLTRDVTSVVSVTEWPSEYSPEFMCHIMDGQLYGIEVKEEGTACYHIASQPPRRQDAITGWKRDGTVYAFWRDTLDEARGRYGFYGHAVRPLIIPAAETCALDTEADWREAERRLRERSA